MPVGTWFRYQRPPETSLFLGCSLLRESGLPQTDGKSFYVLRTGKPDQTKPAFDREIALKFEERGGSPLGVRRVATLRRSCSQPHQSRPVVGDAARPSAQL